MVAPHYFVGSFDDDAGYILTARALLAGQGLNGHLTSGVVISGLYPPGYSALLVPLVWLWPQTFVPLRILSVACYSALFPLTWTYLGRRGVGPGVRVATLVLLALGPPLATFGSMVMAETPFLVLFLVLLLLVDRWTRAGRALTPSGVGVVVAAAGLIWLKQAGIGVVVGLVVWLVWRRRVGDFARAALVAGGVLVVISPVLVARLIAGIPIAGSLYSGELGTYYRGGLVNRVVHVVPHSTWHLLSTAIPATLVPYLAPVPITGTWLDFEIALSWLVTSLAAVGAVVWFRRQQGPALAMVLVYLAETVFWPYVNERRAILVVPILAAWYVMGAAAVWRSISPWAAKVPGRLPTIRAGTTVLAAVLVVTPLVAQMPRDYLYGWYQNGSHFEGSRYAELLAHLGQPSDVVETDYISSTALFTGHRTNNTAFLNTLDECTPSDATQGVAEDHAGFLLLGAVNKPGLIDSSCLLSLATSGAWAVPLLTTKRDTASVFELVGTGTGHPSLTDLNSGVLARTSSSGLSTTFEWDWPGIAPVVQMSVGQAELVGAATTSVVVELRLGEGKWVPAASVSTGIGDARGDAPYLLTLPSGQPDADGVRVVLTGSVPGAPAAVADVAVLGLSPGG